MCANAIAFTLDALEDNKFIAIDLHNLIRYAPEYLLQRLMTNLVSHIATQNLMLTKQIQYGQITSLKQRVAFSFYIVMKKIKLLFLQYLLIVKK